MKIALIVPGGVDRTGERRVIPALLSLIARLSVRHEMHVFALTQEPKPGNWELCGARIHNIGRGITSVRALAQIVREHRRGRFSVVHSIFSGASGLIAVTAASILRVPSVVHVAGGELSDLKEIGYGGSMSIMGRLRERFILRSATAVTAASRPVVEQIERLGVAAKRIPLGADRTLWSVRPPMRRESTEPLKIIHVASLNRVKDQVTLLRALVRLKCEFRLDHVGDDTLNGEIQNLARQLGCGDKVTFHGFRTQRELRPLMLESHINTVTSRHEAGPLVLLEAALCGIPTVGTAVGHLAEWAPEAAVAMRVGDDAKLAAEIERLGADEALRLRIAEEAQRRATLEDADFTAARFEELYAIIGASK